MPWEPQNPGAHLEQGSALLGPHDLYFETGDLQGLESLSLHLPPLKQLGKRITGQERQTQLPGLTSNEGMCRTRGSHSKACRHATREHRSRHPEEPPVGAPQNQRRVPGHAQGGPTAHAGQRGLQSEWQVNAVQL